MGVAIVRDTVSLGVSEVNPSVNIGEFFERQIIPELQDPSTIDTRPVVKAAAIKFVATFRFQFPREQLIAMINLLIPFYKSTVVVVHTYAAYATERILFTKESMSGPESMVARIRNTDLAPIVEAIFTGLFSIAEQIDERENEYAMKAIMRALITADRDILPVYQLFLERLTNLVERISKNPRNPEFNHCLFDSIACIVRTVCFTSDVNVVSNVESLLLAPFMRLLQDQVTEFTPYVFQILAQILERRPAGLGDNFQGLFTPLLSAELWSQQGNVPALTRLIKAYIAKDPSNVSAHVVPLLGIFQKLVSASSTETSSYSLLRCILANFPSESYQPHMQEVFRLILVSISRTPDGKTRKKDNAVAFFAFFVGKFGVAAFMDTLGLIQNDLGMSVIHSAWTPTLVNTKPNNNLMIKEHIVGATRLLTETPTLLSTPEAQESWKNLFVAVAKIVALPEVTRLAEAFANLTQSSAEASVVFDNTFSQLSCAKVSETDYFVHIGAAGHVFCQTLQGFLQQHGDILLPLLQRDPNADAVKNTFNEAGFPLQ
jgi:exportin-2 (importin alpha re-exporter)